MGKRKFRLKYPKRTMKESNIPPKKAASISLQTSTTSSQVSTGAVLSIQSQDHPTELIVKIPISSYNSLPVHNAAALYDRLMMSRSIPHGWSSSLLVSELHSSIFSLSNNLTCSASSCVTLTVTVKEDCVWLLFVNNRQVDLSYCKLMQPLLTHQLNSITLLLQLLSLLEGSHICSGNCDDKFLPVQQRRKGTFYGKSGIFFFKFQICFSINFSVSDPIGTDVVAYFDSSLTTPTIRHTKCEILLSYLGRCRFCDDYR